ncbi:hypothetical protein FZ084_09525 [Listeria monocytogenes]|uniref:hypothetical protein n=1 Tax=Listeria monocytogenes TaxID=1639 RepID=UPI0011EB0EBD|nr:hypothetical protein [Listeria monocytogenes]TYW27530.1 hypothetical protein FZ084_09525 [Listeria monocytogenes]
MNNTSIYNKIETEFSIINDANSLISIAVQGINHYPENFVKVILNKRSGYFDLMNMVRGKEYTVASFSEEDRAIIAVYIYGKNKLEFKDYNSNIKDEIDKAQSLEEIKTIFMLVFGERYYSFFDRRKGRIVLEKENNDRYNVLYYGKDKSIIYITKSRKLNIAAKVLCNYSIDLKHFYEIIEKLELEEDFKFVEELKKLYLFDCSDCNSID